jgi:DNA (cytosine-5)-methyltransferase 1
MGLDYGMEKAGIRTVACVESNPACRETIKLNRPGIPIFEDVFSVSAKDLLKVIGKIDCIIGGPPCQSFSTIGRRGSVKDIRGQALFHFIRLIKEIRPRYFVMENVQGILSAERNGKPLMPWILKQFQKAGYNVAHWLLNSNDYGAPQKRLRVIIKGDLEAPVIKPEPITGTRAVLRDAIFEIREESPAECAKFTPKLAYYLAKVPAGGDWRNLCKTEQDIVLGNMDRTSGGHTSFLRRLSYDRPSPTLVTSPTQKATPLCHPEYTRPLSVAEYQRIQGFPDTWKISGSLSDKYRQLGNAVPIALAQAIGMSF